MHVEEHQGAEGPSSADEEQQRKAYEEQYWDKKMSGGGKLLFRRHWYKQYNRYLWQSVLKELGDLEGRKVLFVGCGSSASAAKDLASRGADVWCNDISPASLDQLMKHPFGDLAERIHPVVSDAENTPFEDDFFDAVVGTAIVHHLDIPKFFDEVRRVCRPGARFVFSEPLGTNPLIELFRLVTPSLRVPTEHPIRPSDLKYFRENCESFRMLGEGFLSALSFPVFFVGWKSAGHAVYRATHAAELGLFRVLTPARWLAWSAIFSGQLRGERPAAKTT
ncbi:class I SAM-dependent methyltransferase [Stieleria mannarensis]|uniref:class I SAM-dependent methyltransferase n=1 Tax=Stieleria mannarensis TaxID=2755585 RepID=UPI00160187C6|nr:class I SAM-dependent methyltransferase [Rhodopirellula sp. JC639]